MGTGHGAELLDLRRIEKSLQSEKDVASKPSHPRLAVPAVRSESGKVCRDCPVAELPGFFFGRKVIETLPQLPGLGCRKSHGSFTS
jgi:hypothetical protein